MLIYTNGSVNQKAHWHCPVIVMLHIPYAPGIPLLGPYPQETLAMCTKRQVQKLHRSIKSSFTHMKTTQRETTQTSPNKRMHKVSFILIMKCYIKMNVLQLHTPTQKNVTDRIESKKTSDKKTQPLK